MKIKPPPPSFDGTFSEFFARHVEPNLPSPERVAVFDNLLDRYFLETDPLYVVRYVGGQERGQIYKTSDGARMLPTDNAPVWRLHAYLLGNEPLSTPFDARDFFATIPCKFHEVTKFETLCTAGFHAAHILDVKNKDTNWENWSREELARRMLLSLHPCNLFLVAKEGWRQQGGRQDIISWVKARYLNLYGDTMAKFLSAVIRDPGYRYDSTQSEAEKEPEIARPGSPKRPKLKPISGVLKEVSGVTIWHDQLRQDLVCIYCTSYERYRVPHDAMVNWIAENKPDTMRSQSWLTGRRYYAWSKKNIPSDMKEFLKTFPKA